MTTLDPHSKLKTLLARCREQRTPCGDGELVWRIWGGGDGAQTVILLHGGFGAWNHWVRNIPTLEARYRVLAPGLLAHLQKRRIRTLILIGSPILGLTGRGPANQLVEVPSNLPPAEAAPLYRHNLQKLMVCDPEAADDLALAIQMENMAKARLRSRGIARTSVLADSLQDLPCPLTCVFGDADVTLDPDLLGIQAYVEKIQPGTPFHIIPGAGHWVQFEAAENVNAILPALIDQSAV